MCHKLCNEFARILNTQGSIVNNVCLAQRFRDLDVSVLGRKTTSPLILPQFFSFENMDSKGRTLNIGETVILQEEY